MKAIDIEPETGLILLEPCRAVRRPPVPEFGMPARRVVMNWFGRGLSGKLLWEIGSRIVESLFPGWKRNRNDW